LKLNEEKRRVPGRGTKKYVAEEDKTLCGATGMKPHCRELNELSREVLSILQKNVIHSRGRADRTKSSLLTG